MRHSLTLIKLFSATFTWENTPCTGTPPPLEQTAMLAIDNTVYACGDVVSNANAANTPFYRCPLNTLVWTSTNNTPLIRSKLAMIFLPLLMLAVILKALVFLLLKIHRF
jgi:hypothetical protein